ncbi:MAG: type II toxin-antitoxin system Phd/YefM family antitoxin [bacterium]|nr:type II toxin-antitoxin system Phd/YefM family antitoxin [bacterium]
MNTKNTLSITDARKKLFSIIDEVDKIGAVYTLTEKGRPKAVIMSPEEYESWVETFEVMKEWPDYKKDLTRVDKEFKSGEYKKYPTLEEMMKEQGFLVSDNKSTYGLSNTIRTKRIKTTKKNTK